MTKIAKVEPKKNGIRDMNISLFGLQRQGDQAGHDQLPDGHRSRRLAARHVRLSRLARRHRAQRCRAHRRNLPRAAAGRLLRERFHDQHQLRRRPGRPTSTTKATTHTDAKLALDPKAPSGRSARRLGLPDDDDEMLYGKLDGIGPETLRFTTRWQDKVEVPLSRVAGVHIGLLDRKESRDVVSKAAESRGAPKTCCWRRRRTAR